MNENKEKVIKEIFQLIGESPNKEYQGPLENCTTYAANIIKANCELIDNYYNNENIVFNCCNDILLNINPELTTKVCDYVDKIKTIYGELSLKCNVLLHYDNKDNEEIENLNKLYKGKYLYFEGWESGSEIALFENIYYNENKDIVWDGTLIKLDIEHNLNGVSVERVYGHSFEDMPYFENAYDFETEECYPGSYEYLCHWLTYNDYGYQINDNKNSRIISKKQLEDLIVSFVFDIIYE